MGAMSLAEYRSIWYNESLEQARRMIVDKNIPSDQNSISSNTS